MTPSDTPDDRLDELRRRWEEDPGSRLFLQLAEEYRHRDRLADAETVLRKGLESHPQQVSARVALGRVQLETGQPAEAAANLERALDVDATNAVAMKLAVEAYLQQGERGQARQRLELYKLLNASDPEIEGLENRVAGRSGSASASSAPGGGRVGDRAEEEEAGAADEGAPAGAASAEAAPPASPTASGPSASGPSRDSTRTAGSSAVPWRNEPSGWSPTAAWPGLPRETPDRESTRPRPPESEGSAASGTDAGGMEDASRRDSRAEPFAELTFAGERRRYLEALGSEGLFPVEPEPEPEPKPEPDPEPEPRMEPEPPSEPETAPQAEIDSAPQAEPEPVEPPSTPSPGTSPSATTPREAALATDRPTVTLGQLYLEQGHPEEALRIFEAVLQRDPDNSPARRGLESARSALDSAAVDPSTGLGTAAAFDDSAAPASAPGDGDPAAAAGRLEEAAPPAEPSTGGITADASSLGPLASSASEEAAAARATPGAAASGIASPSDEAAGGEASSAGLPFGLAPEESPAWDEDAREPPAATQAPSAAAASPTLTAADLLGDSDPDLPPKQRLLHAYLARLRGHRSS